MKAVTERIVFGGVGAHAATWGDPLLVDRKLHERNNCACFTESRRKVMQQFGNPTKVSCAGNSPLCWSRNQTKVLNKTRTATNHFLRVVRSRINCNCDQNPSQTESHQMARCGTGNRKQSICCEHWFIKIKRESQQQQNNIKSANRYSNQTKTEAK